VTQDSRESEGLPGMQAHRGQWDRKGSPERAVPQVRKVMRDSRENRGPAELRVHRGNRGPAELRVHRGCKESLERPAPKVRKVTSRDSRENKGSLERLVPQVRKVMRGSRENRGPAELRVHRGCKESLERLVPQVRKVMRDSRENKGPVELWVHRGCKESPERPEKEKKASKAIPVRRVTRAIKVTRATWVNRAIPGHRGPQSAVLYPRPIP